MNKYVILAIGEASVIGIEFGLAQIQGEVK
jgi:hypothetical protein